MLICPQCSTQNKSHAMFCKGCGASLAGVAKGVAPPPPPSPVCARCGAKAAAGSSLCPNCLASEAAVQAEISATPADVQPLPIGSRNVAPASPIVETTASETDNETTRCPHCGGPARANNSFCGSCGRSVSGGSPGGDEPVLQAVEGLVGSAYPVPAVADVSAIPDLQAHSQQDYAGEHPVAGPRKLDRRHLATAAVLFVAIVGGVVYRMKRPSTDLAQATRVAQDTRLSPDPGTSSAVPTPAPIPTMPAPGLTPVEVAPAPSTPARSAQAPLAITREVINGPKAQVAGRSSAVDVPTAAPPTPVANVATTPEPVPESVPIQRLPEPATTATSSQKVEILRPESAVPQVPQQPIKPVYGGPPSGTLVWTGKLDKNALLAIDGTNASIGSLQGELPGVPVMIEVDARNIGLAEAPGPRNGWRKLVLRANGKHSAITIRWTVMR